MTACLKVDSYSEAPCHGVLLCMTVRNLFLVEFLGKQRVKLALWLVFPRHMRSSRLSTRSESLLVHSVQYTRLHSGHVANFGLSHVQIWQRLFRKINERPLVPLQLTSRPISLHKPKNPSSPSWIQTSTNPILLASSGSILSSCGLSTYAVCIPTPFAASRSPR